MDMDQRLNRLTERHKTLTQSVSLSFSSTVENLRRLGRFAKQNADRLTGIEGKY
jgi:hypothetical protein